MLRPDLYYRSVHDMDLAGLRDAGVTALLVDLDNTLLRRNSGQVTDEAKRWVAQAAETGLSVCIVSNNWHERVAGVAAELGAPIVAKALKPLPHAFRRALALTGASPAQAAVVGDQVFTDVLGGNLIGATTVLVVPLSSSDLPHTRVLRTLERWLLADRRPLP